MGHRPRHAEKMVASYHFAATPSIQDSHFGPGTVKVYPRAAPWRRLSGGFGWVLLSVRLPVPLQYEVSLFFSSLPIRKVLVLPFAGGVSPPLPVFALLFSASYPQDRRFYYLFFNYLFFNYLYSV